MTRIDTNERNGGRARGVKGWVFLAGWLLAAAAARAGTPVTNTIHLEPEAQASIQATVITDKWQGNGFMPVRVRVENRAERDRVWTLTFTTWTDHDVTTVRSERVAAGAGEAVEAVVFVPGNARASGGGNTAWMNLKADGPGAGGGTVQLVNRSGSGAMVITAVSAAQEAALFSATRAGGPGPDADIAVVDAGKWPADWRTWSPFQRVVLTEEEYARLDGARRAALRDWVAMGGALDVYRASPGGAATGRMETERTGRGVVRRHAFTLGEAEKAKLGHAMPTPEDAEPWTAGVLTAKKAELTPETGRLGLSLFLLGFALLVGPVNLFLFAPAHRRQRLFVTVPAISLAASGLLAGYILLRDGFGGEGSRRGAVVLVPGANQAVVTQHQIARTGVLTGARFALPGDVVLEQKRDGAGGGVTMFGVERARYERDAETVAGDWFKSRRVQEQTLRRLVPTRARVELVAGGGGPEDAPAVVSSVGTVLREFRFLDGRGVVWTAEEVAPGVRVKLRRGEGAGAIGATGREGRGMFRALGGAAEGVAPIGTLDGISWDEPVFVYSGPVTEARTP